MKKVEYKSEFMKVYEELSELNEDNEFAAQDFWREAKKNIIAVDSFHNGYDDELEKLGLMDQFDENGLPKSKASYGVFKNADQTSWAVRAALKMCSLRFWNNAKTDDEIGAEKAKARAAAEAEIERNYKQEIEIINDPANKELIENIIPEVIPTMDKAIEALKMKSSKLNLERDCQIKAPDVYRGYNKYTYIENITSAVVSKLIVKPMENLHVKTPGFYCTINITCQDATADNKTVMKPEVSFYADIEASSIRKQGIDKINNDIIIAALNDGLSDSISTIKEDIARLEKCNITATKIKAENDAVASIHNEILTCIENGTQPSKEIRDKIIDVAKASLNSADSERKSWSSYRYDDGDSGAAWAYEIYEGVKKLDQYLENTNWDSNVDICNFHSGSQEEYEQALKNLIYNANELSSITFTKE